jgi:outer membrane protein assembly factor BamB
MRNLVIATLVALAAAADARSWAPREDIEIIALDAKTGALLWTHDGGKLANAHYELYTDALVAYPHYDPTDKTAPIELDPKTGAVAKKHTGKLVKTSGSQWVKEPIVLSNGWRLDNFSQGNTHDLELVEPTMKVPAWTIKPAEYPEYVRAYKDLVFVGYGYLTDQAMLFAYRAGATKPTWSIDFNKLLNKPTKKKDLARLGRVAYQIIDDTIYLQTGEHVFAIDPQTGKVHWRLDAAATLGIKYEPDLYGGALDVAVFSRDADVLVVAFEKRVLALRASTGTLLWSFEPDTFPHTAFPLVHGGRVYLTSGPKRGKAVSPAKTAGL